MINQKLKPFMVFGPGDFIKEELEARDWTQEDLSKITNLSPKIISQLINNKIRITYKTAQVLGQAFNVSPDYWVQLDLEYQLHLNKERVQETEVDIKRKIYSHMPVRQMIKKGWFKDYQITDELIEQVRDFWSFHQDKSLSFEENSFPYLRSSKSNIAYSQNNLKVWFQMAKNCSKRFRVNDYHPELLKAIAKDFSDYTLDNHGIKRCINDLNSAGVMFFVLSHLEKTYLDGASFFDGLNPVIVYTRRYNRNDHFWFTLAHEIGHILMHLNETKKYYLDNLEDLNNEDEKEANEFAEKILKIQEILQFFHSYKYVSKKRVDSCAKILKVDPAIIVGALQYHKRLSTRNLNRYKREVSALIPKEFYVENEIIESGFNA